MAINVNHAECGAQFTEFVNFATRNAGDPDTIVCLDDHERERAPESLRVAMDRNVQFKTEVTALDAIAKGEWEENDVDEPVKTKVRKFAQGFSYCAQNVMQIAVWDALETYRSSLISSGPPLKAGKIRPVYDQLKNTVQAVDI